MLIHKREKKKQKKRHTFSWLTITLELVYRLKWTPTQNDEDFVLFCKPDKMILRFILKNSQDIFGQEE